MSDEVNPVLAFLQTRRSTMARLLGDPGPDDETLQLILQAAARVPDHGKLAPWRFLTIKGEARDILGARMAAIFAANHPEADADRLELEHGLALRAPMIVTVISTAAEHVKIPVWEQQLSAGAVCQNLLIAANSMGFGAQWVTEWWAFDDAAAKVLGLKGSERIAGFIYIGSYDAPLEDRARPVMADIISEWVG